MYYLSFLKKLKALCFAFLLFIPLSVHAYIKLDLSQSKQNKNTALLTVSITNESNESMHILTWNTPFETTLSADIFNIHDGKKSAIYLGRMVKRFNPKRSDYMTLKAGETKRKTIDLSKYYRLRSKERYFVSYKGELKARKSSQRLLSNMLSKVKIPSMEITYDPSSSQKKTNNTTAFKVPASFNACSQTQINTINLAHDESISIAQNASNTMNAAPSNTVGDRYRVWFGAPDSGRQSTVISHFASIYHALDTENINFDCSCSDDYYAYVFPSHPYIIYLCNAFWAAPLTGTDSKAGTIIHETSHFTVVAATDDFAYGQSNAKTLAINTPNDAVFNADNHEYFAENTPYLSMNNAFEDATSIANIIDSLPINGNIANADEANMYVFIAEQTGIYTFYTTGGLDSYGRLYGENLALIVSDDDGGTGVNFEFVITLQQGKTYYIEVSAYGANTGIYSLNSSFDLDTDHDGIGNSVDTDDDNDGVLDIHDAFPLDASESLDTDHDGIGNNADNDDDNDGILDSVEIENGLNPLNASDAQTDLDGDGFSNIIEISLGTDIHNRASKPIWAPVMMDNIIIYIPTHH